MIELSALSLFTEDTIAREGHKKDPWSWYPSKRVPTLPDKKAREASGPPTKSNGPLARGDERRHIALIATGKDSPSGDSHDALLRHHNAVIQHVANITYVKPGDREIETLSREDPKFHAGRYLRQHRRSHDYDVHQIARERLESNAKAFHAGNPEQVARSGKSKPFSSYLYNDLKHRVADRRTTRATRSRHYSGFARQQASVADSAQRSQSQRQVDDKSDDQRKTDAHGALRSVYDDLPKKGKRRKIVSAYLNALSKGVAADDLHSHISTTTGSSKGNVSKVIQNFHERIFAHPEARRVMGSGQLGVDIPSADRPLERSQSNQSDADYQTKLSQWGEGRKALPPHLRGGSMQTFKAAGVYGSYGDDSRRSINKRKGKLTRRLSAKGSNLESIGVATRAIIIESMVKYIYDLDQRSKTMETLSKWL